MKMGMQARKEGEIYLLKNTFLMKLYRYYKKNIFWGYINELKRAFRGCESFIELGCGPDSPTQYIEKTVNKIGVDIHEPWLNESKKRNLFNKYILADIRNVFELPLPETDCVMLLDVIEHLEKEEGIEILENAEKFAKKTVIVSTPNGFMKQEPVEWDPYSEHKCGWTKNDFEKRGYKVIGISGWKKLKKEGGYMRYTPEIICFILSEISQFFVRNNPEHAFEILAIKRIK